MEKDIIESCLNLLLEDTQIKYQDAEYLRNKLKGEEAILVKKLDIIPENIEDIFRICFPYTKDEVIKRIELEWIKCITDSSREGIIFALKEELIYK